MGLAGGLSGAAGPRLFARGGAAARGGGLSWDTEEDELKKAFAAHGEVLEARVILDRDGRSRGFGFVTMADIKDAKVAMQALDGSELDGRALRVSPATVGSKRQSTYSKSKSCSSLNVLGPLMARVND